jgi:hypothetical protein
MVKPLQNWSRGRPRSGCSAENSDSVSGNFTSHLVLTRIAPFLQHRQPAWPRDNYSFCCFILLLSLILSYSLFRCCYSCFYFYSYTYSFSYCYFTYYCYRYCDSYCSFCCLLAPALRCLACLCGVGHPSASYHMRLDHPASGDRDCPEGLRYFRGLRPLRISPTPSPNLDILFNPLGVSNTRPSPAGLLCWGWPSFSLPLTTRTGHQSALPPSLQQWPKIIVERCCCAIISLMSH